MKKFIYAVALLVALPAFQSCLDDKESLSVTEVRDAKKKELQSLADLNAAKAQAEAAIAAAQVKALEAEAAMKQAQATLLTNEAALKEVEKELKEVEVLIAKEQLSQEKVRLQMLQYDLSLKAEELRRTIAENNYRIDELTELSKRLQKETEAALADLNAQIQKAKNDLIREQLEYNKLLDQQAEDAATRAKAKLNAKMIAYQNASITYYNALSTYNNIQSQLTQATYGWTNLQHTQEDLLANNSEMYAYWEAEKTNTESTLQVYQEFIENNYNDYQDVKNGYNQAWENYYNANDYSNNLYDSYVKTETSYYEAAWNLENSYYYKDGFKWFLNYFFNGEIVPGYWEPGGTDEETGEPLPDVWVPSVNYPQASIEYGTIYQTAPVLEDGVYSYAYVAEISLPQQATEENPNPKPIKKNLTLFTVSYKVGTYTANLEDGVDYDQWNPGPNDWSGSANQNGGASQNPYIDNQIYRTYVEYVDYYTYNEDNVNEFLTYVNNYYGQDGAMHSIYYFETLYNLAQEDTATAKEALAEATENLEAAEATFAPMKAQADKYEQDYLNALAVIDEEEGSNLYNLAQAVEEAKDALTEANAAVSEEQEAFETYQGKYNSAKKNVETWQKQVDAALKDETTTTEELAILQAEVAAYTTAMNNYKTLMDKADAALKTATAAQTKAQANLIAANSALKAAQDAIPEGQKEVVASYKAIFEDYTNSDAYLNAYYALYGDGDIFSGAQGEYWFLAGKPAVYDDEGNEIEPAIQGEVAYFEELEANALEAYENAQNSQNYIYTALVEAFQYMQDNEQYMDGLVSAYNTAAVNQATAWLNYRKAQIDEQAALATAQAWNSIYNDWQDTGMQLQYYIDQIPYLQNYIEQCLSQMHYYVDEKTTYEQDFVVKSQQSGFNIAALTQQKETAALYLQAATQALNTAKAELEAAMGSSSDSGTTTPDQGEGEGTESGAEG